jgi:lysozyme
MNKEMFNVNFSPQQEPAPMAAVAATQQATQQAAPAPDFGESLYLQLLQHEGTRQYSYKDRDGRSIGIGFNLNDKDNQRILADMGYNVQNVIAGKVRLTEPVIRSLYETSVAKATKDANKWIPNLSEQPEDVQKAVIDMSFNLGATRLGGFVKTRAALINKDYKEAAKQMMDSPWAKQVGKRANTLSEMVRSAT